MNSLTRNSSTPQIRCRSLTGGRDVSPFLYEANLQGEWVAINYQFAEWLVEDCKIRHEAEQCRNLTGTIQTGAASLSTSLDTTARSSKSSSCVKAMSMSACSLLSGSATSLKGLKNDYQ